MEITKFHEKLNKVDGKVYVIEEEIRMPESGVYEAPLQHDNITVSTLNVYTGPKLTGNRIQTYVLTTPSLTPWKRIIRIQTEEPVVYITYETDGDTVEAEDVNCLQGAVTETQEGINTEAERAKEAEKVLNDAIKAETVRAEASEGQLRVELAAEVLRAGEREGEITRNLSLEETRAIKAEADIMDAVGAEESRASAKELELQGSIDAGKAEVLKKIEDLIGTVPEALDTLKEIADALGNDPDFADTIINLLSGKVDKEAGKQLTSNDYSDSEKATVADLNTKKHIHDNKTVLDEVTQAMLDKLAGVAEEANKYIHPITAGNKHIPSGGASGQILKWSADGTAAWEEEKDIVYTHPDSGVTAGTYKSVMVNAQGHVTGGSNPSTLSGYGITDAAAKSHNHDSVYLKKGSVTWADLGGS